MEADNTWIGALEADLHALAHAEVDLDRDAEVAERIRIERAGVGLLNRVKANRGPVELHLVTGRRVAGVIAEGSKDWLLIESASVPVTQSLVFKSAIVWVRNLRPSALSAGAPRSRTIASVCREWTRDRADVHLHLADGSVIAGRMSAAYSDHVDVVASTAEMYAIAYCAIHMITRVCD